MNSSSGTGKQYGLIIPKKGGVTSATRLKPSATFFETECDDDEEQPQPRNIGEALKKEKSSIKMKLATQSLLHDALAQDQDVFEYDKVFDKMHQEKAEREGTARGKDKDTDRKPKYINALIKASQEREKEFERRTERLVQREREAEGNEFGDKESFVTPAYKKKLEERREAEVRERELERVEAKLDVTKQDGLGMFYKYLLKQQTGEEKVRNADESYSGSSGISKSGVSGESGDSVSKSAKRGAEDELLNLAKRSRREKESSSDSSEEETSSGRQNRNTSPKVDFDLEDSEVQPVPHGIPPIKVVSQASSSSLPMPDAELKAAESQQKALLFIKRSTDDSTLSARERYLARKAAKQAPSASATDDS